MRVRVARTCREVLPKGGHYGRVSLGEPKPLSEFRDKSAYVLLGDPGMGKTTEMKREQEGLGDDAALVVSARNFRTLAASCPTEWGDKTLFIDGLDETRAGATDSRTPLDDIRTRLSRLDKPRFRLSCREADWLGSNDRQHLQDVSPDSEITVLRLDPLDADGVSELLRSEHQVSDVQEFVQSAHRYGVGALLGNPLTLDLLARVVQGVGEWPRSRQETLERACWLLASEHNEEHRFGRGVVPTDTVLDAAGYLCALLLLAGMEGYSLSVVGGRSALVGIEDLSTPPGGLERDALAYALNTKLFTADTGAERSFAPLHRQVAEFLAGRYLARRIEAGLPAGRAVALMTGPRDGRVVTALRGLSAWLAAHSSEARRDLIAADPVGVGVYGDIGRFNSVERERLIEALPATLMPDEAYRSETAWGFRGLASADLVPTIRQTLGNVGGSIDDRVAALLLGVLGNTDTPNVVTGLAPDLMAIVDDDLLPPSLRRRALSAYLHVSAGAQHRAETLRALLDEIDAGLISDPDDDLRGILLKELYPVVVSPAEVWRHLTIRSRDDYFGRLRAFRHKVLLERSEDRHLAELLDTLEAYASDLVPALLESHSGDLPIRVLERALDAHGQAVSPKRLSGWLAVASRSVPYSDRRSSARVRVWLEQRPRIQKAVYLESLRTSGSGDGVDKNPFWYFWHSDVLHGSQLPPDFGLWCLDRAVALDDTELAVSLVLLDHAHASLEVPAISEGLTIEKMHRRIRGHTALERRLDELLQPLSGPPADEERRGEIEEHRRRIYGARKQQREEWAKALREHEAELWENRLAPPNLSSLAMTYLGMFAEDDKDASPVRRVSDFIDGDPQLVEAVTAALRDAVLREDIPSVDETISLHSQSRQSWMAYPVLASLHLLDSEDSERLDELKDARRREALAIYYCVAERDDYAQLWDSRIGPAAPLEALDWDYRLSEPHWYVRWLQQDPDLVLDVLCRCAQASVRAGEPFPPGMDDLEAIEGHEALVHDVRLKLLRAYPTRSSNKQIPLLDRLLTKALDHVDKTALLDLARHNQALTSLPVAQQVRWWATDALISEGSRLQQLKTDLVESETRIRHFAQFLSALWDRHGGCPSILTAINDPVMLKEMIEMLGSWCAPAIYPTGGFVYTLEMDTSELIQQFIEQLGSTIGDQAEQALEGLIGDSQMAAWKSHLTLTRERQRVVHRDASYRHPSVEEVQQTLANEVPANAADLTALLSDQLRDLAGRVRTDSRNIWSLFWNADSHGRPTDPKPENNCRDALLTALTALRLPGVDLDPEASHASGWRSDIRARCGDFNVPIEIKRDRHRDLWRALRSQLIGQYTTDPATSGYGTCVVLWFGDGKVQTPPDGNRPRTSEELEERLVQDLTEDERRKISVIVLDVSKPTKPGRAVSPLAEAGVRS